MHLEVTIQKGVLHSASMLAENKNFNNDNNKTKAIHNLL